MTRILRSIAILCFLGLPLAAAQASNCSATADFAGEHAVGDSNKHVFSFHVQTSACGSICSGYVKYAVRYHYGNDSQTVVDRTLTQYYAKGSNVGVSHEHWIGSPAGTRTVIDSVDVEDVSCG